MREVGNQLSFFALTTISHNFGSLSAHAEVLCWNRVRYCCLKVMGDNYNFKYKCFNRAHKWHQIGWHLILAISYVKLQCRKNNGYTNFIDIAKIFTKMIAIFALYTSLYIITMSVSAQNTKSNRKFNTPYFYQNQIHLIYRSPFLLDRYTWKISSKS